MKLDTRANRLAIAKLLCGNAGLSWTGLSIDERHALLDIAGDTIAAAVNVLPATTS